MTHLQALHYAAWRAEKRELQFVGAGPGRHVMDWLQAALSVPGIRVAPLEPEVAVASTRLPGEMHGDPADRLIVATARHLGATLVTADAALLAYGQLGHVQVLPAR